MQRPYDKVEMTGMACTTLKHLDFSMCEISLLNYFYSLFKAFALVIQIWFRYLIAQDMAACRRGCSGCEQE